MDIASRVAVLRSWGLAIARQLRLPRAWDYLATPLGSVTVLAVVTLVCGMLVERFALVLSGITAFVLLVGIAWPRLMVLGLRASLEFDLTRAPEGRVIGVTMRVVNRWPFPIWGLELYGLSDCVQEPQVSIAARPWSREDLKWSFTAPCRGVYPTGSLHLATGFPFGLVKGRRAVSCAKRLFVSPQPFPLDAEFGAAGDVPWDRGKRLRSSGGHGDMAGLRPYRIGDTLRRIHWAQTAKHQQIVVCEREAFVRPAVELYVDLDPASHDGGGPQGTLEWSLRIAASICQAVLAAGGNAKCVLGDRRFDLDGRPRQWQSFLDFLAEIPRLGLLQIARAAQKHGSSCARLVITSDAVNKNNALCDVRDQATLVVFQRDAFTGSSGEVAADTDRFVALSSSRCIILDAPDRVASQLARGLQMEAGRC